MRYLHTMLRVRNLDAALDFYCNKLGLKEVRRRVDEKAKFTLVFLAASTDDELVAIVTKGGKETGFVLQVYGYWDMVCAFVLHGMLSEPLVYDTCQEMYFQFAKIHPYLKGFRQKINLPEWMQSLEKVAAGSPRGRKRLAVMRANLEQIGKFKAEQK